MTDPNGRKGFEGAGDGAAADLAAVKQQFLEAEQRLRELAQGAVELTRASVMLKKARMGISDGADGLRQLSVRLSEYIDTLAELTQTLARTSAAVENLDSGETQARLERMEESIAAIHHALGDKGGATEPEADTKALVSLEGRLSMVHGAVEGLQQIAQQQLSAQRAAAEEIGPTAHEEAAADKLNMIERGLAAIHQIVSRVEEAGSQPPSGSPSQPEPGPRPAEVGQKLDALAQRLDNVQQTVQTAASQAPPGHSGETDKQFEALDARLATIQSALERAGRVARRSAGEAAGIQLGLYPDLEQLLDNIANDLRTMEALNVDMVAELRRSLGQEITRQSDALASAFDKERSIALSEVSRLRRTVNWLVVGIAALLAGVLYLIFR